MDLIQRETQTASRMGSKTHTPYNIIPNRISLFGNVDQDNLRLLCDSGNGEWKGASRRECQSGAHISVVMGITPPA